jgi:outer membrane receptor protein involved in Fe transport
MKKRFCSESCGISPSLNKKKLVTGIALALMTISSSSVTLAQEPDTGIERVIVTGQKLSRTLQDTPDSVAVFNTQKIEELNLSEFSEVLFETANVHSSANGGFSIRGIDSVSVSGSGTSALASVYLDGAPLPTRLIRNGLSTWDVSQVEILRGPQSTLQGRNSLAGAVVMTTQAPSHDWNGKYRLQFGEYGEREAAIAVGGSLVEDQLAFRFSGEKETFDGFTFNITRQEEADFREDDLYRLKLLYTPNALEDFSALLTLTSASTSTGTITVEVPEDGDPFDNRTVSNNDPLQIDYDTDILNLKLDYALNNEWDFSSITTYSKTVTQWENFDSDLGPEDDGTRFLTEEDKALTQELRLTFDYENITGVFGAYYFSQDLDSEFGGITTIGLANAGLSAPFLVASFGLDEATADFVIAQYVNFDPVQLGQLSIVDNKINTRALFADFTYKINDKWDIFAGLRWDREKQENGDDQSFSVENLEDMPDPSNYPAPLNQLIDGINAQLLARVFDANQDIPFTDGNFTEVIPKIGVSYRWNEDITASFILQQGFRSGGVGVNTAKATPFQFDPEFTTNYELSLRSIWLDGKLSANANVFYIDWEEQQIDVQLSASSFDVEVFNAGSSKLQGFELELNYQVNSELNFYSSLGQAKSEFTDFLIVVPTESDDVVFDLSGRSFADSPEWTANVGFTYKGDNGVLANASVNYADSSNTLTNPYSSGLEQGNEGFDLSNDERTLVNMQLGYEWESIGVYLIGKNILDEQYIENPNIFSEREITKQSLSAPRQFSLSVRGSF